MIKKIYLFHLMIKKKYRIFHEDEYKINELSSLSDINDGKLTRKFYFLFMLELIRDYLYYETSYNNPNIASLRKLTYPNKFKEIDNKNKLVTPALGIGNLDNLDKKVINNSYDYRLKDFETIHSKRFVNDFDLDFNSNSINKYTIFVPNKFNNINLNDYFNNLNINLININRNELPQLVKYLIRTLNIKNIQNTKDLAKRIKIFNYNIIKNLEKLDK
jgi:hypothetical protein